MAKTLNSKIKFDFLIYFRDEAGIIHNATPIRKRRDDRVLDEYEESWFEHDEDEINHTVNEIESYSTKPLSAKLKDVDLIDTMPTPDSPPLECMVNGSSSPLQNISNRPDSPTMRSKQDQACSPDKKQEDANSPNNKISVSPPTNNNSGCFPLMKPITAMNNKPVMNIVINSSLQKCNNAENENEAGEKLNGASTNNTNTEKTVVDSVVNHEPIKTANDQVSLATKTKPVGESLIFHVFCDFPDLICFVYN